jgi:hypothetical protein
MDTRNWLGRARGALLLALGLGALAGCEDAGAPTAADPLAGLTRGIHPLVVLAKPAGDTVRVELRLHQVEMNARISSFQGELTFDTGRLTLVGAEVPPHLLVAWNEVEAGRVRLAGAGAEGLGEVPMLVLRFVPGGTEGAGAFKLGMEEIVAGEESFTNVTSQLVSHDHTLVTESPVR